jgi:hypothetical protein
MHLPWALEYYEWGDEGGEVKYSTAKIALKKSAVLRFKNSAIKFAEFFVRFVAIILTLLTFAT